MIKRKQNLLLKKKQETLKEVEKARGVMSYTQAAKEDFGDSVKYVNFEAKDKTVKKLKLLVQSTKKKSQPI